MISLEELNKAFADYRVIAKTKAGWFEARPQRIYRLGGDASQLYIVFIRLGPGTAKGIITNVEENTYGREFRILPPPGPGGEA